MASLAMTIDSDDEFDLNNNLINKEEGKEEAMEATFNLFDTDGGALGVSQITSGTSWNFQGAIELLAKNDKGFPERVGVRNIIQAERREMLDGEKMEVSESESESGSDSGSQSESESESDSDDGSDSEQDQADDDHVNENLEDDGLRHTIAQDEDPGSTSDADDIVEKAKAKSFFEQQNSDSDEEDTLLFSELNICRPLMRGIAAMGYTQPTPIQAKAVPPALAGRDICGSAVTGSGKTLAFLLPILEKLLLYPRGATRALILAPTRELAAQCISMMTSIARFTELKSCLIVGGAKNNNAQAAELRTHPDVVVATPGRLLDLITNAQGVDLDDVCMLVLDEADRLLELGFVEEVTEIIKSVPVNRQTMLFSATFGTKIDELIKLSMKRPVRVRAGRSGEGVEVAPRLEQEFVRIRSGNEGNREAMLLSLLSRTYKERTIVFFDTKLVAHRMLIVAGLCGIKAGELHGNLTQVQRLEALEAFKAGDLEVLFCTDLAARGLDVNNVQAVINFEMPNPTTYVHRIGRTARAGCGGKSCTLISEGRRHLMKDVVRDAEKKNAANALPGGNKEVSAVIKSRTIPLTVISFFNKKIIKLQPHIAEVIAAEAVAKLDRRTEMEATRAQNVLLHADEIATRPKKEWFQDKNDKQEVKDAMSSLNKSKLTLKDSNKQHDNANKEKFSDWEKQFLDHSRGKKNLTRKEKRKQQAKEEMAEAEEERREERERGDMPKQSMKANAKKEKLKEQAKKDVEQYDDSCYDEDMKRNDEGKKMKKRKASDSGGLFDHDIVSYSAKMKKNEERAGLKSGKPSAGAYTFKEFDPKLIGAKKKQKKREKSLTKHKRKRK